MHFATKDWIYIINICQQIAEGDSDGANVDNMGEGEQNWAKEDMDWANEEWTWTEEHIRPLAVGECGKSTHSTICKGRMCSVYKQFLSF